MNKNLVRLAVLVLTTASFIPGTLKAQDVIAGTRESNGRNGGEQIIITRKADSTEKMVIVVEGNTVLVNGKPVSDDNKDVTVTRRKVRDVSAVTFTPNTRYRVASTMPNTAVLGVTTESADKGVTVLTVSKKSGAEKAGLKEEDVITKIDDKDIDSPDGLSKAIRGHKPGDKVSVSYLRSGKTEKATAELGKMEEITVTGYGSMEPFDFKFDTDNFNINMGDMKLDRIPRLSGQAFNSLNSAPRLGLTVQDTDDGKGVKVLNVNDDGNAGKAGIAEEDVIVEVDGKAVNSADEIAKVMKDSKDKMAVTFKYLRDGKSKTVDVKIPRKLKTANL